MRSLAKEVRSKLPDTETSVFAVMTQLADEHGAINLSQGFPDFEVSPVLIDLVAKHMRAGNNQYAPMPGVMSLRESIAEKTERLYGATYHPEKEITVTAGATQAIFAAISAFIGKGDEAIVFEPAYDSYVPTIKLNGGVPVPCKMRAPDFSIDWEEVRERMSPRTKMVIINTPHNPSGSILDTRDMHVLQELLADTSVIVLSDEVYEHLVFDGRRHESVCLYPSLAERSLVVCSFGKTFHATGWKTGYCLCPAELMREFRKIHQFMVFCSNAPVQHAIGDFLKDPANYEGLDEFFQAKRDDFVEALKDSRFSMTPSSGTYFQLLNFEAISDEDEMSFARRLTIEHGVASVPISPFYSTPTDEHFLRFCFGKSQETLGRAADILRKV